MVRGGIRYGKVGGVVQRTIRYMGIWGSPNIGYMGKWEVGGAISGNVGGWDCVWGEHKM